MIDEFATTGYQRHNVARQSHLANLGLSLRRKTVLELGAGIGDHTEFWLRQGCSVTAVEGRSENASRIRERFPSITVVEHDLESRDWPFGRYDIVYAYGILYHLQNPWSALDRWIMSCGGLLLLETVVSRDYALSTLHEEDSSNLTACLHGRCLWPSRLNIVLTLQAGIKHVYLPKVPPEHEEFPHDWDNLPEAGLVRQVYIASRKPLRMPSLKEIL